MSSFAWARHGPGSAGAPPGLGQPFAEVTHLGGEVADLIFQIHHLVGQRGARSPGDVLLDAQCPFELASAVPALAAAGPPGNDHTGRIQPAQGRWLGSQHLRGLSHRVQRSVRVRQRGKPGPLGFRWLAPAGYERVYRAVTASVSRRTLLAPRATGGVRAGSATRGLASAVGHGPAVRARRQTAAKTRPGMFARGSMWSS
jgi:hypothetical protein